MKGGIYTTEFCIRIENEDDFTSVEAGEFRRFVRSYGSSGCVLLFLLGPSILITFSS